MSSTPPPEPEHSDVAGGLAELERLANNRSRWRPGDRVTHPHARLPGTVVDIAAEQIVGVRHVWIRWDASGCTVWEHPDALTPETSA